MPSMELSLDELADFAKKFVAELPKEPGSRACIVGLKGTLGAGKTTFAQFVARELGVAEPITSPTFVFVKTYPIVRAPFKQFVHVDAYRLALSDKDTIGWTKYARDPGNLILVEWPENLSGFPPDATTVSFSVTGERTRSVHYHVSGS